MFFIAVAFVLSLLWKLKFPLTYKEKVKGGLYCYLTADICILTEHFYKCFLSSKEVVQIPHLDLLPWQLKV